MDFNNPTDFRQEDLERLLKAGNSGQLPMPKTGAS
jgi:hypothetical protein